MKEIHRQKADDVLDQLTTHSERDDLLVMNVCAPIKEELKLVRDIRNLKKTIITPFPLWPPLSFIRI